MAIFLNILAGICFLLSLWAIAANWVIVLRLLFRKQRESLVPLFGIIFSWAAAELSGEGILFLAALLDPATYSLLLFPVALIGETLRRGK